MKRHPSLVPLSRFHRSVLFLALISRENAPPVKGYPVEPAAKIEYAIEFYKNRLKDHFTTEEKLWGYITQKYPELSELINDLNTERKVINELFQKLIKLQSEDILYMIGPSLEKHVRRQERELFQKIQKVAAARDYQWINALVNDQKKRSSANDQE